MQQSRISGEALEQAVQGGGRVNIPGDDQEKGRCDIKVHSLRAVTGTG